MEAGRALDALVAEKVMGWKRSSIFPNGDPFEPEGDPPYGFYDSDGLWVGHDFPHYSTDIAAAWSLVEHVGGSFQLTHIGGELNWSAVFFGEKKGRSISADSGPLPVSAPTPSLAICLAALKAVGEK